MMKKSDASQPLIFVVQFRWVKANQRQGRRGIAFARCLYSVALLVTGVFLVGCGPKRPLASVGGKVTYQNKPLQFGNVMFQASGGQPAIGKIQSDGTFQMQTASEGNGAPVGRSQVRVLCFEGQNPRFRSTPNMENAPLGKSLIPKKYSSYATSGFVIDVLPKDNKPLILELTDK